MELVGCCLKRLFLLAFLHLYIPSLDLSVQSPHLSGQLSIKLIE